VKSIWLSRTPVCRRTCLLLVLVLLLVSGCRLFRRPAPRQEEPTIKVRVDDSVQEMKLEEYIMGVVAGEMDPDWPVPALGAQAIIARTFTLNKVFKGGGFEKFVASTDETELQAYSPEDITDNVRTAVQNTRGVVATYEGKVIMAWFHSCAGGMTTTPKVGLNFDDEPTPYIEPVNDDFPCEDRDTWRDVFTASEVAATAARFGVDTSKGIQTMTIGSRDPSGRAIDFKINGTTVNAADFRVQLDPRRMKSTLLTELDVSGSQITMAGRGFGHGVGMSQYGARAQANNGKTAEQIVQYYYKDIALEKRWE